MRITKLIKAGIVITVFCAVFAYPVGASAATAEKTQNIISSANEKIDTVVQRAQEKYEVFSANGFSDDSMQILKQCAVLQNQADKVTGQTEKKLDKLGAQYESVYYTVNIGNNEVLIDPFLCVA